MITHQYSAGLLHPVARAGGSDDELVLNDRMARIAHVALALYLTPLFLVVMAIGGLGVVVAGISRLFGCPVRGPLG